MSNKTKPETQYFQLCEENDTQDIVDFFNLRLDDFAFPTTPNFYFQANTKQKNNLIKISKITEQYQEEMGAEILVQVNSNTKNPGKWHSRILYNTNFKVIPFYYNSKPNFRSNSNRRWS